MAFINETTGKISDETPAEYLKRIRKSSCYGALRGVIEIAFLLLLVTWVLGGIGFVTTERQYATLLTTFGDLGRWIISGIVWFVGLIVLFAARQASHLLIDIADSLLESNQRR